MKNKLIILSVSLFAFLSCTKEKEIENTTLNNKSEINKWIEKNSTNPNVTISDLDELKENELKRTAYNSLNSNSKKNLWIEKFNLVKQLTLTKDQNALIEDVIEFINKKNFNENINKPEHLKLELLKERAINLFGFEDAKELLNTLNPPKNINSVMIGEYNPTPTYSCGCSKDSDWCGSLEICSRKCRQPSNQGCGTLFLYSCTNSCQFNMAARGK